MGHLIPGSRFRRFGDTLINSNSSTQVPSVKGTIGQGASIQGRKAAALSATAAADINRTAPTFNDPRYTFTTLSIPTDLRTLNGLYRFFDDTDPVVGNAIRLHSEFPLSRISLRDVGDKLIQRHYEEMWDKLNVPKLLFDIALEYWRIGNVFPYGAWNASTMMWDQFVILNPDYVTVEGTYLNQRPLIKLQPDEHLKKIIQTGQPKMLYDQLPPEVIKYVRMGQEIPLSPNNVFHLAHNKAPYETLGRSIIKRILKSLIYEDRMSMANFAIATRQVIPITIVKLGDPNSGWVPEEDEMENVRELFNAREVDPNLTIFYHWGINVEFYGASGKIWNLTNEFNRIMKWKMIGLGISEAILTGGANYATAYAQLEVLRQRYLHFQNTLSRFVYEGMFAPVARQCGFYKSTTEVSGPHYSGRVHGNSADMKAAEQEMLEANTHTFENPTAERFRQSLSSRKVAAKPVEIYPMLDWDLLSLSTDVQYRNFLMNLDKLFPGQRKISDETFYAAAKLDPATEKHKLEKEFEDQLASAFDKAELITKWQKKFAENGLPFPANLTGVQPGQPGAGAGAPPGGMGGAALPMMPGSPAAGRSVVPPGGAPQMGGAGGGAPMGGPPAVPNAPVGRNNFTGGAPASPAEARIQSQKLHKSLLEASMEIDAENEEEIKRLRKFNADAGVPVDEIDAQVKNAVEDDGTASKDT